MSDNNSNISASVAPSDSASNVKVQGKKKNRPGKNQRLQAKSALTPPASSVTGESSLSNQQFFASAGSFAPVPQPGKFPIVFQVGAGEPTRDSEFSYDPNVINETFNDTSDRFVNAPRFAEFASHSGYTDEEFNRDVVRFSLLGLAQQTVFSHVNMGLPLGDFSSLASTDTFMFSSLRAVISQFGEFSVPNLGTRFLLSDYDSTVKSLVHAASKLNENAGNNRARVRMMWLPHSAKDRRTKHIVATRLQEILLPLGGAPTVHELQEALFERASPAFGAIKQLLGGAQDRFDFLFREYRTAQEWVSAFTPAAAQGVLTELRLIWPKPALADLDWNIVPKVKFPELVDIWARKRSVFSKFFSLGSGLTARSDACGSASQLSTVTSSQGVNVVKTMVAVTPDQFSLSICFPPSVCTERSREYNVVMVTSIPVKVRATEFTQRDWIM